MSTSNSKNVTGFTGLLVRSGAVFLVLAGIALWLASSPPTGASNRPGVLLPDEYGASVIEPDARIAVETGVPLALYGLQYPVTPAAPETMARQFLSEQSARFKLQDEALADLVLASVRTSLSGTVVRFDQQYKGIAVYKGTIAVHINNEHVVTAVANDYKPGLAVETSSAAVTAAAARAAALNWLQSDDSGVAYEQSEMVIYAPAGAQLLAHRFIFVLDNIVGEWEVLVDAHSGAVVKVADLLLYSGNPRQVQRVDGNGNVFDPDPLSSANATYGDTGFVDGNDADTPQLNGELVNVPLRDIQFSGGTYTLLGPYAEIRDFEGPFNGLFQQASSTFNFNRFDDGFEAVNTYYHLDSSMRYINETLGIPLVPYQYLGGVRFDPHALNGSDNSYYSRTFGHVAFGEGGVDDAEDSDVIHHELGHGLHDWVTNGNLSTFEGLSEGSGDYWAQSYNRSLGLWTPSDPAYHYVFNWDGHNPFWPGRTTNYGPTYPGGITPGCNHSCGQIWSTCMMKVWDGLGHTETDTIFLEGLGMAGPSSGQNDTANFVLQAAIDLNYSPTQVDFIYSTLSSCGYTLPVMYDEFGYYPVVFGP